MPSYVSQLDLATTHMTGFDRFAGKSVETPYWRPEARGSVEAYRVGLDLLGSALEFAAERLGEADLTRKALAGSHGRGVLPILAARAIGTVDAIHAVLSVGRVEQGDMLIRTLVDLQADAHLLASEDEAFGYYADWATVEQARGALQMRPDEIVRPGRDLEARRQEIARELAGRLREFDSETAGQLAGRPLDEVLEGFSRRRYGSRRPTSWRQGYMNRMGLSSADLRERIIATAARVAELEGVPDAVREAFQRIFERELELLFGYLSGEIHNSPLAMNRLIDPTTLAIRVYGDIEGLPRPLGAAFQHLLRIMLLFEHEWTHPTAVAEWSDRALAISTWMDEL